MTNISGNKSVYLWLRSIVAMHFLGKEETGGSSPLGASKRPQRDKVGFLICGGLKSYA